MLEDIVSQGLEELNIRCNVEAIARLKTYCEELQERNKVMNLTAITGEADIARLHFLDCAALLGMADFSGKKVLDVGSGAGFPGLVLKILKPDIDLCLLDSLEKRINFLSELCCKLKLNDVKCVHMRAEEAPPAYRQNYDIVVSRAVARLGLLAELCLPFVKKGGLFIAMKGPAGSEELEEAMKGIEILGGEYVETVQYSVPGTDKQHNALIFKKVADTPMKYPRRWAQIKKQPL